MREKILSGQEWIFTVEEGGCWYECRRWAQICWRILSRPPSLEKIFIKYTSSGFGQFMASPTDLIKTQIQMEGRRRLLGYEARVEGATDALRFLCFSVGFQGFEHFSGKLWLKVVSWGCGGAAGQMCRFGKWLEVPFFILQLQRAALVNLGDLSTYDRWSNTTEGLEIPQIYLCSVWKQRCWKTQALRTILSLTACLPPAPGE